MSGRLYHKIAIISISGLIAFGVTKGVDHFLKVRSVEMAPHGIQSNKVSLTNRPTLSIGQPQDLHFVVHDLGISNLVSFDEAGDVAYVCYGDSPKTVAIKDQDGFARQSLILGEGKTLLRRFGGMPESFPLYSQLLPGGNIFTHNPTVADLPQLNGKAVFQNLPTNQYTMFPSPFDRGNQSSQSDDGIYFLNPFPVGRSFGQPQMQYIDWTGNVSNLDYSGHFISFIGRSSLLGSVAIKMLMGKGVQVYQFIRGKTTTYNVDANVMGIHCAVCRDSIYLTSTELGGPREIPWKLDGTEFVRQPLPPGAYSANVVAAGSASTCILNVAFHSGNDSDFPFVQRTYYVEGNRGFEFEKVLKPLGLDHLRVNAETSVMGMDARGDVIVAGSKDSFQRLYFLERVP